MQPLGEPQTEWFTKQQSAWICSQDDLLVTAEKGSDKILVFFSDNDPKERLGVKPIRT